MPQYIIDAHTHIFPRKIAAKAASSIGEFYSLDMQFDGMTHELLEEGDRCGVALFLVCSVATKAEQVSSINDFVASKVNLHPDRLIGLGALHPEMEDPYAEIERIIALGLRGIKLHSDFQCFDIDDERMMPVYRRLAERGLPVLFHTGDARYDYSRPEKLARVARAVPELTCIGAHFGGYQRWEEAAQTLCLPNVYVDCSGGRKRWPSSTALAPTRSFSAPTFPCGTAPPSSIASTPCGCPRRRWTRFSGRISAASSRCRSPGWKTTTAPIPNPARACPPGGQKDGGPTVPPGLPLYRDRLPRPRSLLPQKSAQQTNPTKNPPQAQSTPIQIVTFSFPPSAGRRTAPLTQYMWREKKCPRILHILGKRSRCPGEKLPFFGKKDRFSSPEGCAIIGILADKAGTAQYEKEGL